MISAKVPTGFGVCLGRRSGMGRRSALAARAAAQGFALVVVLVMLAALALGTAASLRGSAGSVRIGRVQLMQAYAQEQARLALAYCQAQLLLPSAVRDGALSDAALRLTDRDQPAWRSPALWSSGAQVAVVGSATLQEGTQKARCFVERQSLPEQPRGLPIYLITARGFSPDAVTDAASGALRTGTSVWLQRVLLIEDGQVRARTERRLVRPPLP